MKPAIEPLAVQRGNGFPFAVAMLLIVLVACVYWPIHQAWFVWDDKVLIHDNAWLSSGSGWRTIVLHGIADWRYFRPLGLALFVAEIRWFGIHPGPMHLLSLALHLINTALVGALAWRLRPRSAIDATSKWLVCTAMLVYGLHPVLVEPVAWIASQFDLLLTLFILAGLLCNLTLRRTGTRAGAVTFCFLLAAFTKESAIAFPILLVLFDWFETGPIAETNRRASLQAMLRRQWPVYASVFTAGIVYLVIRTWAKSGYGAHSEYEPFLTWERLQTVCHVYMIYWRMIVWPFVGLSPQHLIPTARFAATNTISLTTDLAALVIGTAGLTLAWRRKAVGILIVGVTVTLFPVLHVIPMAFDDSLYHERYAMPAIALVCVLLPCVIATIAIPQNYRALSSRASLVVMTVWLLLATLTVRTTIPLWFDDIHNWEWSLRTNPGSEFVLDSLMATYLEAHDWAHATALANTLMAKHKSCADCMIYVGELAMVTGDIPRAQQALQLADTALQHTSATHSRVIAYVFLSGNLRESEHDEAGAEAAYRGGISIDPMQPLGYMYLAMLLASEGRTDEAHKVFDKGRSVSPPDTAKTDRANFMHSLEKGAERSSKH